MGHGIGILSCSIYIKELIAYFGVKQIIRVGSCGAIRRDVNVRDIIIGMGASTDSKVNRMRFKDHDFTAIQCAWVILSPPTCFIPQVCKCSMC